MRTKATVLNIDDSTDKNDELEDEITDLVDLES